jgi:hypothetical protein
VWVGPQRVSRAPVPVGELVLIGSLVFRVVDPRYAPQAQPGTHTQLSEWLVLERKTKGGADVGVAAERDALAQRLASIHRELEAAQVRASAAEASVRDAEARAEEAEAMLRSRGAGGGGYGGGVPAGLAEQVAMLADAISALRASLRAVSDESAVMPSSPSAEVIVGAVASATGELERARDALRALQAMVG